MERRRTRRHGHKALGLVLCLATTVLAGCPATKIAEAAGETGTSDHGSKPDGAGNLIALLGAILLDVFSSVSTPTRPPVVSSASLSGGSSNSSSSSARGRAPKKSAPPKASSQDEDLEEGSRDVATDPGPTGTKKDAPKESIGDFPAESRPEGMVVADTPPENPIG